MIENVILLCSEITKGMKSYGPKAFIPIGNKNKEKPLIIKQIDNIFLTHGKNTKIYIIIGFEYDKFIKILDQYYPLHIYKNIIQIYNEFYDKSNNAYSLSLALDLIGSQDGDILIIQNGILTDYSPKNSKKSLIPILKNNNKDESFNIGLTISGKKVEYMFYDLPYRWSEILYINNSDIESIKNILTKHNLKQKFLFEMINLLIDNNIIFETEYIPSKHISKINNHKIKT